MANSGRIPGARFATLYPKPSRVVESSYRSKLPGGLTVTPTTAFNSSGHHGGSFTPTSKAFILTNSYGDLSLDWTASITAVTDNVWAADVPFGTLAPGASVTVIIYLVSPEIEPIGTYLGTIVFNNATTPMNFTNVAASLVVGT